MKKEMKEILKGFSVPEKFHSIPESIIGKEGRVFGFAEIRTDNEPLGKMEVELELENIGIVAESIVCYDSKIAGKLPDDWFRDYDMKFIFTGICRDFQSAKKRMKKMHASYILEIFEAGRYRQMFKVLSIDFDYFQDVMPETLKYYPEGRELGASESQAVWQECYAKHAGELQKVRINHSLLTRMKTILCTQDTSIPVLITQNHKDAYWFIKQHALCGGLDLVNVDLHHDIINGNKYLDCGNWISHTMQEFENIKFRWIARKVSGECYGIKEEERKFLSVSYGLDSIMDEKFDAVFICRSDMWLPPHLDTYFDEIKETCLGHFDGVDVEFYVDSLRDLNGFPELNITAA